jgi:hypothetical protein
MYRFRSGDEEGKRKRKKELVDRATHSTDTVIHTFFLY